MGIKFVTLSHNESFIFIFELCKKLEKILKYKEKNISFASEKLMF